MGMTRVINNKVGSNRFMSISIFSPRIWKIMIVAAYPFFLMAAHYFEALERTGRMGAFVADTFLPLTLISYVGLIFVLRKHSI